MPTYTNRQAHSDRTLALQELKTARPAAEGPYSPMIERLRTMVPFDDFAFSGLDIEGCHVGQGIYLASSFSEVYRDIYTSERLIEVDPLAKQIREDNPVARWEAVSSDDFNAQPAKRLLDLMNCYEIGPRTGLTFWNKGRSYGAAMFTRNRSFTDDEVAILNFIAPVIHSELAKPVVKAVNNRLGLTKGEIICLRLASQGLSSEEISREAPFTVDTINTYLKSATKKLKAGNRSHAVAEAIRRRIIE